MSGSASTRVTAEKCLWREEGGGAEAAARCLAFLEEVGIEVDWIGPDDEAQLLDGLAIIGGRLLVDPETPIWPSDLLHEGGHIAAALRRAGFPAARRAARAARRAARRVGRGRNLGRGELG